MYKDLIKTQQSLMIKLGIVSTPAVELFDVQRNIISGYFRHVFIFYCLCLRECIEKFLAYHRSKQSLKVKVFHNSFFSLALQIGLL